MQMNYRHVTVMWATLVAGVLGLLLGSGPLAGGPAAAAPAHRPAPTTSVVLERSGGFLGITEVFTAGPKTADPQTTDRRTARLMGLTSSHRFRSLDAEYLPPVVCCDRYRYRVVVRYADGSSKTVTTVDEAPSAPRVLQEVVSLTAEVGTPVVR